MTFKTKFAGGINPFTGRHVDEKPTGEIVVDDNLIFSGRTGKSKYSAAFIEAINHGLPIRCSSSGARKVGRRLSSYIRERRLAGSVKVNLKCEDGYGRVWYVKGAEGREASHPQQ